MAKKLRKKSTKKQVGGFGTNQGRRLMGLHSMEGRANISPDAHILGNRDILSNRSNLKKAKPGDESIYKKGGEIKNPKRRLTEKELKERKINPKEGMEYFIDMTGKVTTTETLEKKSSKKKKMKGGGMKKMMYKKGGFLEPKTPNLDEI